MLHLAANSGMYSIYMHVYTSTDPYDQGNNSTQQLLRISVLYIYSERYAQSTIGLAGCVRMDKPKIKVVAGEHIVCKTTREKVGFKCPVCDLTDRFKKRIQPMCSSTINRGGECVRVLDYGKDRMPE